MWRTRPTNEDHLYSGESEELAARLTELAGCVDDAASWQDRAAQAQRLASRFHWSQLVEKMDEAVERLATRGA